MDDEERAATLTAYRVKEAKRSVRRECAEIAYSYPTYTLEDAYQLPQGDRKLLLTYARLHRAEELQELVSALAASQSKEGYRKFTNSLKSQIKDLTQQL